VSETAAGSRTEKPSLRRELLFNLALLAGAAISLAVLTALVAQSLAPELALAALVGLILADVVVIFLFGRHLIARLVLRPMADLTDAADALAAGDLARRAPGAETREFDHVAKRFNHMTERLLDAQRQLARAEKLASLGHLAAGIAHEVGNPLTAIGHYVELLEKRGGDAEMLAAVERELDRIDAIVRGLLAYARPGSDVASIVDVGAAMRTVVGLLTQQGALRTVDFQTEIDDAMPPIRGKADVLEQILVNLVLNAVDAAGGGTVVLGASRWRYQRDRVPEQRRADTGETSLAADRRREGAHRPWRPEIEDGTPGVLVWVADSGPGIAPDARDLVFEPFYTTKEPGRGTGLGLAVVQRLVHEAGGIVWVDAAREGGASLKFFLPATGEAGEVRNASEGGKVQKRGPDDSSQTRGER